MYLMYHDCEIYADAYEFEQAYRLECNADAALENTATQQHISEIDQQADDLLERMDAHQKGLEQLQREQDKLFEEWLA